MKFKKIPKSYIKVILDRLFRLKPASERYERVFNDILNKFLIFENREETDTSCLNPDEKISLVCKIFNSSLDNNIKNDHFINEYLKKEEERLFLLNPLSKKYLEADINFNAALEAIKDEEDLKLNLLQMLQLNTLKCEAQELRKEKSLLYPIEKVLLCEGATEEILLGKFSTICEYDFKKNGIYVLGAGGKNQVARKYYSMAEEYNIPIFILLDSDAQATKDLILPKLRAKDRIYIIHNGEFEDILPKKIITDALNYRYSSCYNCKEEDFHKDAKTAKELYEIFKQKGFGDFKKADFAKTIKDYITTYPPKKEDLTEEIKTIIEKIKTL